MLNAQRTYTGCVATSMAQVMYYFKYPAVGQNSISYNDDEGCGKRLSLNFATRRFDWDNMQFYQRYYVNDLSDLHIQSTFTLQSGVLQYPVVACIASLEDEQYAIEGYPVFMSTAGKQHKFDAHVNFSQGEAGKTYYFTLAIVVNGNIQALTDLMEFTTETTGVDTPSTDGKQLSYDGHSLKANGQAITVYNLQGAKVLDGTDAVSTNVLAPGMYIARAGSETLKFSVK